ncbi:MAG: hypothetical protein JO288_20575 [Hyphomicrobiales bacterium]|nr:hypothetical protein [Hyphomicrobiales bacterium]
MHPPQPPIGILGCRFTYSTLRNSIQLGVASPEQVMLSFIDAGAEGRANALKALSDLVQSTSIVAFLG